MGIAAQILDAGGPDAAVRVLEATSRFFPYFDMGATLMWALSGAMLGAKRGFPFIGVFAVALVSATGGGLLRDGLFLQDGPPVLLRTPIYLELVAIAAVCVVVIGKFLRRWRWLEHGIAIVDAVGLGAYAVVGMNLAMVAGLHPVAVMFVGMVNAVGGSVLRDVMIGDPPQLLRPGIWLGGAALVGCILFPILHWLGVDDTIGAMATVVVVFLVRVLAVRFGIEAGPLGAFEEDWRDRNQGGAASGARNEKTPDFSGVFLMWCPGEDSNLHGFTR